ncbi:hypothetical protein BGZ94_000014 [Podila epigama]|nr:hypothetical protein BGZ94_000014 [Podila epigama]
MTLYTSIKELIHPPPKTDDPKNWPRRKKNTVVFIIAYCAFTAPLASNIYMPAVLQVKTDLQTTSSFISATLSVYVLFMGIMPVFWASLCDYYGRRPIYLVSNLIFIVGSIFAALSRNAWLFFVMRAIQAFGASSALSVGGGSLSDVFHSGERGQAFGLFYLGPLIAPMVGPFLGGVLSDHAGWRSTMWLLLGTAIIAFLLVLFLLPETYRHQIDPAPVMEDTSSLKDDPEAPHSNLQIHSTYSDPTLVASKSSLHEEQPSSNNTSTQSPSSRTRERTASTSSLRPSLISRRLSSVGGEGEPAVPSAMEFIVPNYVPPYLMDDDDNVQDNDNVFDEKVIETDISGNMGSSSRKPFDAPDQKPTTIERHVAFPALDKDVGSSNEKQECSTDNVSKEEVSAPVAATQTTSTMTTTTTTTATTTKAIDNSLKRKPFNPLRPLLCLLVPTNSLLVGFNALALASQFSLNNTLPISFSQIYHLDETMIGLCFCAGGLGSALGSILGGRYSDYVMRRWLIKQELKRQRDQRDREAMFHAENGGSPEANSRSSHGNNGSNNSKDKDIKATVDISVRASPEVRLQSVWLGVIALPLGLMLFGWSVNNELHLAYPLVGIFISGYGMMMVLTSATTALIDANSDGNMATSAVACNSFARGVMGAVGGFTALPMLEAMGNGWLYTFWALMTLLGAAGLVLMVRWAPVWRRKAAEKAKNKV